MEIVDSNGITSDKFGLDPLKKWTKLGEIRMFHQLEKGKNMALSLADSSIGDIYKYHL